MNLGPGQRKLAALLFTDMVGSTALKQQLGDKAGLQLIGEHHELLRQTLQQFAGAQEIKTAGDSFLLSFATPSAAVSFALLLQERLCQFNAGRAALVLDRIGIHLGEVSLQGADDAPDLHGLHVDLCARVMGLAQGGQILMTRAVFDSARQTLKGEDLEGVAALSWVSHGRYLLKGLDEPVEICEVAESGQEALRPPDTTEKARRHTSPEEEPVLGWRPAVGQQVGRTDWVLEEKLGEGGFGEVWVGRHRRLKERRVFKFCFRADRVRSLKREMTLFRLIKERIGDHPNIVSLREVYFDEPPYYVEMDYAEGQDLASWCAAQGGAEKVGLETKLEIVAQVAEALQAAHECGVIHRDVKPGNILVGTQKAESRKQKPEIGDAPLSTLNPQLIVKLTDFGIGQVISGEYLADVTKAGFTQTMMSSSSSHTGTQLYLAPELMAGEPATTRSDLYSLGVVLYQLLVGAFNRPLTSDWVQDIGDSLLREDIRHCVAGKPEERFAGAGQLAKHLRDYAPRKAELERREAEKAALERVAYRRGMMRTAAVAAVIVAAIGLLAMSSLQQSRRANKLAKERDQQFKAATRSLYAANLNLAQQAWEQQHPNVSQVRQLLKENAGYADRDFEWYYWQRQTHLEFKTLRGHLHWVTSVAFSPDNRRVVTGSWDRTAKVWDATDGQELLTLSEHANFIWSVAFSPDNRRVATGSGDQTAKVWDATSGQKLLTLKGHTAAIRSVAFSPDNRRMVTGSDDRTAKVWDATTGQELLTLKGHGGGICSVAFSLDNLRIVTGSWDQTAKVAKVWDATTGQEQLTLKGHTAGIRSVAFSPDNRHMVTGSEDRTAKVWDATTGQELLTLKGHGAGICSVAFSLDNRRIVTGSWDQTAKVWDATTGQELLTLKGHAGGIYSVAFSPDIRRVVTGSADETAKVWDATGGQDRLTLEGHDDAIRSVAFSPDNRRILTGSWDRTAKVWDATSGQQLLALKGHADQIWSVAFSPDTRRVVTGSRDQTAKVWDASGGQELLTLKGHSAGIRSVAFSPDNRRVVTGSGDQTAKVWDATSGQELLTLKGHTDGISSVAFSPDNRRVVTGSADQTAKLWDATGGQELLALKGHTLAVSSVAVSSDNRRLVTGSFDQTAVVWWAASIEQVSAWDREETAAEQRLALARKDLVAARERERVLRSQDPGAIRRWLVLAPLPYGIGAKNGAAALDHEQVSQEAQLRPLAGQKVTTVGGERVWTKVEQGDGLVDFNRLVGDLSEWSVAYAFCYVRVATDQSHLVIWVGSDDQSKIYLDGREIYDVHQARPYVQDVDAIRGVHLKAGTHALLFKVVNQPLDWQGSVRFTDAAGQPVPGLEITLTP